MNPNKPSRKQVAMHVGDAIDMFCDGLAILCGVEIFDMSTLEVACQHFDYWIREVQHDARL